MALSFEEIQAAKRMYAFVRNRQRVHEQVPYFLRWAGRSWLIPLALLQIAVGNHYGYYLLCTGGIILIISIVVERQRDLRYREEVVILQVIEREHPDEFSLIVKEEALAANKFRLFVPTN